jgi:hypothetical protein
MAGLKERLAEKTHQPHCARSIELNREQVVTYWSGMK